MMNAIYQWFAEPLAFPFMQQALIIGLVVAIICATLSCYLVLKGWSLMGDAISHAVLPGIVLAYMLSIPLAIGAFFSGVFCTIAVGYLKTNSRIKEDAVMGIVFSGMFAIGLVMFTKVESNQHLMHILFGDLLGITAHEFYQSLMISAFVFLVIVLKRRDFLLYCLLVLLALVIISAMQVVGVILVVAMLITPGITGYILTKRFERMMLIAILTSVNSVFWGIFLSFHFDAATGPFIVLIQAVVFLTALAVVQLKLRK